MCWPRTYTMPQFGTVIFTSACVRHTFTRHLGRQNPPERQFKEDFVRTLGRDATEDPDGTSVRPSEPECYARFADGVARLAADGILRPAWVRYDEYDRHDNFRHHGAELITQPGLVVVLRQTEQSWHFWTSYFTHTNDDRPHWRQAVRTRLQFYTAGSRRIPEPEARVRVSNGDRYRTRIQFVDASGWGLVAGRFDVDRIPLWPRPM
ncbi:hypothetical protein [Fimbriiglobus ruber]|uniref:Uncharacterized protein n=1 Tax=Fimbriiglobus ruber TaxID=1908690 RepID=A0A225DI51_9BACT|nr:hypothetical protein [Fimbriiglobus ruber]OWK41131.1 hypothetical protein FRUB_05023 [Fimbriiglobus ruber]